MGSQADSDTESSATSGSEREGEWTSELTITTQGGKILSKEERKAHKKAVKEANRERRSHKMPKHVKKKLVNRHKRR